MEVKNLNYDEKLQILKDIFDSTNIVLIGAYNATSTVSSEDIYFVLDNPTGIYDKHGGTESCRADFYEDDKTAPKLIAILTGICSG
jgi:hypothetical protein